MKRSTITKAAAAGIAGLFVMTAAGPSFARDMHWRGDRHHVYHQRHHHPGVIGGIVGGAITGAAAIASAPFRAADYALGYDRYDAGYGAYAAAPEAYYARPAGVQPYEPAPALLPGLPPSFEVGQRRDGSPIYAGKLTTLCTFGLAAQDRC